MSAAAKPCVVTIHTSYGTTTMVTDQAKYNKIKDDVSRTWCNMTWTHKGLLIAPVLLIMGLGFTLACKNNCDDAKDVTCIPPHCDDYMRIAGIGCLVLGSLALLVSSCGCFAQNCKN